MFMHGGIAHLLGNMLFLWIFGDNVEDRLGKRPLPRLLSRLRARSPRCAHVASTVPCSEQRLIPSLGASGAISGVLAGYLALFPQRRRVLRDPGLRAPDRGSRRSSPSACGSSFQLISGIGMLGARNQQGGVAYAAHIGGFVAGYLLVRLFDRGPARTGLPHGGRALVGPQALPIQIPVRNTRTPPTTTWKLACRNGVSM